MKFIILVIVLGNTFIALNANAMFNDDPWLRKVAGEFEYLNEDNDQVLEWDIDVWSGRDLSKFWLKSSGEYSDSEFEGANLEFVYSRAVSPYWDHSLAFGTILDQALKKKAATGFLMVSLERRRTLLKLTRGCLSVRTPARSS